MNEAQAMLGTMADALFAGLGHRATIVADWQRIEELGLPLLLVGEADGGFGGSWDDARLVFRLAGYHALALPVVEAVLAAHVAAPLGFAGRGTVASACVGEMADGLFRGEISGACASEGAAYVVAPFGGGGIVVSARGGLRQAGTTASGEARDIWGFDGAQAVTVPTDVLGLGAFARAAQIAGALDAALGQSVAYANERRQFGRPLAGFQAVQQSLATFACEAAAANCAAIGAAQALDRGEARFEVAAAKLRANEAVGVGTAIAHQLHGAIGFTREYPLHQITRRLWIWRSEFGSDSHWARAVGARVLADGAEAFWPNLTARTD